MKTVKFLPLLVLISILGLPQPIQAKPGDLDLSFNGTGLVVTNFRSKGKNDSASALAIQQDGKIIAAGSSDVDGSNDFALARYNPDGTLDTNFGTNGFVTTDFYGKGESQSVDAIAIQQDGQQDSKIVVAGLYAANGSDDFALARYNMDGILDKTFGTNGMVTTDFSGQGSLDWAHALIIQQDGKIIAAGGSTALSNFWEIALARYNADGTLDTKFGSNGLVITHFAVESGAEAMAIQQDGKIVIAGYVYNNVTDFILARYNADGKLDTTFGTSGIVTTDFLGKGMGDHAYDLAIQQNGKIVAAGSSNADGSPDFALARYDLGGTLDTNFGMNGVVTTDFSGNKGIEAILAITLQRDEKIVAGGMSYRDEFVLARYNADGKLDTVFGTNGIVTTHFSNQGYDKVYALAIQQDGRIVAAGFSADPSKNFGTHDFALARYYHDNYVDPCPVGAVCNDNDACTTKDLCDKTGSCHGTPVVCQAPNQCYQPGTCDLMTGLCSPMTPTYGAACDDHQACTSGDQCVPSIAGALCQGFESDRDRDGIGDCTDPCPTINNATIVDRNKNGKIDPGDCPGPRLQFDERKLPNWPRELWGPKAKKQPTRIWERIMR